MFKNLFLISCISLSTFTLRAQEGPLPKEETKISPALLNELNRQSTDRLNAVSTDREEINGWVSFELTEYNLTHGPSAFYTYGQVISPDSLPRVSFTDGAFRSFVHGFGQIFDPTAEDMALSDAQLTAADAYTIDSIGFPSIYRRVNHNGIDDTLVITIAVTDKETEAGNPYDGSYLWTPSGLLPDDTYVMAPAYTGTPVDGYHHGLTGTSDAGANVEIQQLKFALTAADTELFWRSFPVNITAEADQVVYTFVEFQPSFEATIEDTAFVFDGALGEANTNSYRTIYDFPVIEQTGYFFDLFREDQFSYNASYVAPVRARYAEYTGDDAWRNDRLDVYSWWGFRFEYYMNATSSVGIAAEESTTLKVYPNPANRVGTITVENDTPLSGTVILQDIEGRVVYQSTLKNEQQFTINAAQLNLSSGVYMLHIQADETAYHQQLVIE